ncbi:MAG: TonB-dependent receptor [Verrucomicrobiaceae bacterium]|nr:MAG: TonB-dependent receptor [Verrucomicrobiaceae bacterium]
MKIPRFLMFVPAAFLAAPLVSAQTAPEAPELGEITVSASRLGADVSDLAQPVTVLEGRELLLNLEATLGETLAKQPGVRSTYFGPASSRPVIRGLDGDRIRVLQNGLNTIDASATSFDHAVSFDPVSVSKIEVVRGPATVLFGPNAIGGVVNVTDNRIPSERIGEWVRGSVGTRASSADNGIASDFELEGGAGGFAWHLEGYKRNIEELEIPGYARSKRFREANPGAPENDERDRLENSWFNTEGFSAGTSYVWDGGYFGLAYSGFDTDYGSPAEKEVSIDLRQRRWDFHGAFYEPFRGFREIKYRFATSDYEHTEFEGPDPGTTFTNDGYDGRVELSHEKWGPLQGTFGYQTQRSDFEAVGDEKFLPQVLTKSHSAFIFEEMELSDGWRLEGGLRFDHTSAAASEDVDFGPDRERKFDTLSGSLGVVFTPNDDYTIALSSSWTERAPTYQELYAGGPHVATGAFEVGDDGLDTEKSLGFDLSFRKVTGQVTGAVTVFYNRFNDYIGLFPTGGVSVDGLPIFAYQSTDAEFFGAELEATYHLLGPVVAGEVAEDHLDLELRADYVQANDRKTGDPLPRISPFHASAALDYKMGAFGARLESVFSAHQAETADNELPTDSYVMFNAAISYTITSGPVTTDLYIKGVNLTDEEAREHTSFLKESVPLSGRGVVAGVKVNF